MIKTITKNERKFFVNEFLEDYEARIASPASRLARIFGVFKVNPSKQSFIIMESIVNKKEKSIIFDLKGSSANRLIEGVEDNQQPPPGVVLKDNNYRLYRRKIKLDHLEKINFIKELKEDFMVLASYDLMDYSLLLAFLSENCPKNRYSFVDKTGQVINIGIIDILERYSISKKGERKIKTFFHDGAKLSVASPNNYFSRISEYLSEIFD